MAGLSDTSLEAERVLIEVYRNMPVAEKWLRLGEMYQDARALHAAGVRVRNPAASQRDILQAWLVNNIGFRDADPIGEPEMEQPNLNLRELRVVVTLLTDLGIPYALGGSMASSIYGVDRYTRDADITAEPFPGKEAQLVAGLGSPYYVSIDAIRDAIRTRSTFNIINTSTGFKVDVFIRKNDPFEQSAMARRMAVDVPDTRDAAPQPIIVHSPEDIILFKLRWYRLGNETAEQQLRDVLGVLRARGALLDQTYLDRWAATLKVADLLARVRQELVE